MLDIVYNPNAGCGLARSYRPIVEKRLRSSGVDFAIHETSCEKDGIRIARELSENGSDKIIAMGGDGTVNEVLNGIIDLSSVYLESFPAAAEMILRPQRESQLKCTRRLIYSLLKSPNIRTIWSAQG